MIVISLVDSSIKTKMNINPLYFVGFGTLILYFVGMKIIMYLAGISYIGAGVFFSFKYAVELADKKGGRNYHHTEEDYKKLCSNITEAEKKEIFRKVFTWLPDMYPDLMLLVAGNYAVRSQTPNTTKIQ